MHRILPFAVAAALTATLSAFQTAPPRDVRKEPSGTATISGVVQTEEAPNRPMRRAAVVIAGDPLLTARQVFTDANGRFTFVGLPAGEFTVTARRNSYMSMSVGSRKPGGTGSPVVVASGQRISNIVLRLTRFSGISGTVYDQTGEPAQGVWVEALRYTMRTGVRTLSNVYGAPTPTDDRGMYQLGGLEAGEYYVAAGPSNAPADLLPLSASDVDRALQLRAPGALGAAADAAPSRPRVTYAPVFYPGSPELSGATAIALKLGEERGGIDVRLQLVPTARVDGVVSAPDGQPVAGALVVASTVTEAYSQALYSPDRLGVARSDAQGRFSYSALPPGRYVVTARGDVALADQPGAGRIPMWAMVEFSAGGADQRVGLTMQPGMTVSGRIAFDGTTLARPAAATTVRIGMQPAATVSPFTLNVTPAVTGPDGTFTITGIPPGQYRLSSSTPAAPAGWALRSATIGADRTNVLDAAFEVREGQNVDGAIVTFTDHPTELSGALLAPTGVPTSDYFIIVFAADKTFWTPYGRRIVMTRPSSAGRYVVRNLPPGEYCITAVTDVEQGGQYDPSLLTELARASVRVTLGDGEKKVQDLKIAGG